MHFHFVMVCTLLAITSKSAVAASYEDCATNIVTLQDALYDKDGYNSFQLEEVFYPPSVPTSRFIRVIYSFFNENNELDDCNVTFVWSTGEVLFVHPPATFKYTSLYFSYPNNNLEFLYIRLPYECRGLVNSSSDGECSCGGESSTILQALTQQITVYARYFAINNGERIETTARAVCTENLQEVYFSNNSNVVYILLCTTIILPLVMILVLFLIFRGLSKEASTAITKSKPSFVSFVIVGFYLSVVIFIFDVLACYAVTTSSHEYADYVDSGSINLQINYVTLFIDTSVLLSLILCILYAFYYSIKIFLGIQKQFKSHSYILKFIILLIGKKNSENFKQISDNDIIAAIFPFMLFLPIISFSSHCIYIVLSWLTEPEKASFVFLVLYLLIMVLFYSFKSLYKLFSSVKLVYKKKDITTEAVLNELSTDNNVNGSQQQSHGNDLQNKSNLGNPKYNDEDLSRHHINTQAFCLTLIFSTLVVGLLIMFVAMFIIIPFQSASLIDYVVNVFQIFVLILSSQFALKVIFRTGFDLNNFIEIFINALGKKDKLKNDNVKAVVQKEEELFKVAGVITAELTSTILDLAKSPEQE